jgi:hypothetical protein
LIVQKNDVAQGTGGLHFTALDDYLGFGNGGFVSFVGDLENGKTGLWAGTDNNVQAVALEDAAPPGFPGREFGQFITYDFHATTNNWGRVAFERTAEAAGQISIGGIWSGAPGSIQLDAYEGMPVAGLGPGAEIKFLHRKPQINDDNEVGFWASVGPPLGLPSDTILLKTSSGVMPVYNPASVPPGYGAGTSFGTQLDFYLADDRQIVFYNRVRLPDASLEGALMASDNGAMRLVARDGERLPGLQPPQNLNFGFFWQYYMNNEGRVAFLADYDGDSLGRGIWVEDANRQLVEIARSGMQIELAPGDVRTLTDIQWPGAVAGNFSPLLPYNATGEVVFEAWFGAYSAILRYTPALSGDYNGNGVVDAADFVVWRNTLNAAGTGLAADGNGDGHVDSADYQIWRSHLGDAGTGLSSGGRFTLLAIPEPLALNLLLTGLIGGISLFVRWRGFAAH